MSYPLSVTEVKIWPIKKGGKFKAQASIVINGELRLSDLKIFEGENGLFVGYPSKKGINGMFYDVCHPVTRVTRNLIQDTVLQAYEKATANI